MNLLLRRLPFLLVLGLLFAPSLASAGPWTLDQNHFYLQAGAAFTSATDRWDMNGDKKPIIVKSSSAPGSFSTSPSNFQQLMSDFYFEYGAVTGLTLFGDFPFLTSMRQLNPGGDINYNKNGVGDLMLGARIGILLDPLVFSIEARATLPTGDPNAVIPTGTGDFRGELRLLAAKSLEVIPIDFEGEFGFTERGNVTVTNPLISGGKQVNNYSPEIFLHGEVTLNLAAHRRGIERVLVIASVDYRASTREPELDDADAFSIIPTTARMLNVNGNVLWFVSRYGGINLRYTRALLGARVPIANTFGGAIFVTY